MTVISFTVTVIIHVIKCSVFLNFFNFYIVLVFGKPPDKKRPKLNEIG